jgi:hypothetical protein
VIALTIGDKCLLYPQGFFVVYRCLSSLLIAGGIVCVACSAIDLSISAARALGMMRSGIVRVKLE